MIFKLILVVFVAGAIGGLANALISDNGFIMPRRERTGVTKIVKPGFLGNAFVGGISAIVSWGLYGPFAHFAIYGKQADTADGFVFTVSALVGAILVGVAGARWLTNEVDKLLLRAAASQVAYQGANPGAASRMSLVEPETALEIASQGMPGSDIVDR